MTLFTSTIQFYESFKEQIGKTIDLGADTFKMLLTTSSYIPDLAAHSVLADISNEVAGAGYSRQTLLSVLFSQVGGVATFDFDDPVFSASGGNITARRWVIFDDSVATPTKPLICTGLIDSTDQDIVITDGNTLTMQISAQGLFTLM